MEKILKMRAKGRIIVKTYDDKILDEQADGPTVHILDITEDFIGDIKGKGHVRFIQAAREDGSASFVGIERVVGKIGGKSGTFLLQDEGTVINKKVMGKWFVVQGSGTGELKNLRGEGGFNADLGQNAEIWLDYSL